MSTGVLREGGSPHVVEDIFAASTETGGSIGHLTFSLGIADFATQIGLSTLVIKFEILNHPTLQNLHSPHSGV